jgi:prolyl oligopeptidase
VNVVNTLHGMVVSDPYRWLEDDNDPEVVAWVAAQKKCADEYLARIPFRAQLASRVKEVSSFRSVSSPWRRKGHTFYYESDGVQNHSVLMHAKDGGGPAHVLLDPNTFSQDGTVGLAFAAESRDCKYLAFGKTQAGSDWRTIYIMEIATGKLLPEVLVGIKNGGVSWHTDGFFYDRYDLPDGNEMSLTALNEGEYTCYHRIDTDQSSDAVVFRDLARPRMSVGTYTMERCPYLFRYESDEGSRGNRVFIKEIGEQGAWDAPGDFTKIYDNTEQGFWPAEFHNGMLYGNTELDAPNGRLVRIVDPMGEARMETVVPEREQPISGTSYGGGRIYVTRMKDVHDEVSIYDYSGTQLGTVKLPGPGNAGGFWGYPEDTTLYYSYSSFTTPTTIYEYHVATNTSKVYYQVQPPLDPTQFEEKQVWVTSKDGTKLPMFVVHKKGLKLDGTAPTMVFGYGGFGITYGPGFNALYIPWLEQGGVVAIPNLRGGGEYGEDWHDAGRKEKKQNVFDDCIAAAEWLIANQYTSKGRIALNGRSNGGLLVGAVMLQRPDLFRVAVPEVGVLDMLRYHLFTIGRYWTTDYGSADKAEEFPALFAYSPYHNVRRGVEYPSTMVMTSDHDDRVVPAHSFKFAAALQAAYKGNRPMLLRVETQSGHGAVNRQKGLDNVTDKYAFMWSQMGFLPRY